MIQGRGHLEEERLRCRYGCQSADPCRRTAVNRREEKRGMVGCFREKEEEVVIKLEEMVEVARVEFLTPYSYYQSLIVVGMRISEQPSKINLR